MTNPMTNEEFLNFSNVVKCNWLKCAGGMGLSGNGCCSFRGDYKIKNCPKFIDNDEYEQKENYKGIDDHCTADDRHKCINFEPVLKTHGCCEYLLVTGECDFPEELKRTAIRGWRK